MKSYQIKNFIYSSTIILSGLLACYAEAPATPKTTVAITQIVPHPSLDLIRKGIQDELSDQKVDCEFSFENAQGNIATATQIAQKFVSINPTVIVPISTPSTMAVYALANAQNIPVIFAAVNDPVKSKLVPSMKEAGKGITGVSDLPPYVEQIALIRQVLPNARKIGVVYNPGESNSVSLLELFEKELSKHGMTLIKAGAANMVDVTAAAKSLVNNVDAIYLPNDNTVVAALEALLKVTQSNGIPVFCSDPESVKQGCLAAVTHSQYGLGRQTGKMVAKFLKGTDIQKMPVETPAEIELSINQYVAQALNVKFPQETIRSAKHVINK